MIFNVFYNEKEKILIIAKNIETKNCIIEKDGKISKIYNEKKELIGINLFDYHNKNLKQGIVNIEEVKEEINKYFDDEKIEFPYVIGEIEKIEKHPKSEKLNICQVNIGDENLQIVCGAANVGLGIKVIVARVGAVMPNGMEIKPSKLIDIDSNGMICSYFELGKSKETGVGIAILDDRKKIGEQFY